MIARSAKFTGTGSTQIIPVGDIGGQIDLVWIWNEAGNYSVFGTKDSGGNSFQLGNDSAPIATDITNIGSNQFTVGSGADANQNADVLHYLAVRNDGANDFKVGTYVGDGAASKSISGLGFQPDFVLLRRGSPSVANAYDNYRSSGVPNSGRFDSATINNRITSLDADGFSVGSSTTDVNDNGVTYYYVAFKNTSGKFKHATYTGNGSAGHGITGVGFKPDEVMIIDTSTSQLGVENDRSDAGDKTQIVRSNAATTGIITSLDSDGFTLGTSIRSNQNTDVYNYFAFLAPAPVNNTGEDSYLASVSPALQQLRFYKKEVREF